MKGIHLINAILDATNQFLNIICQELCQHERFWRVKNIIFLLQYWCKSTKIEDMKRHKIIFTAMSNCHRCIPHQGHGKITEKTNTYPGCILLTRTVWGAKVKMCREAYGRSITLPARQVSLHKTLQKKLQRMYLHVETSWLSEDKSLDT